MKRFFMVLWMTVMIPYVTTLAWTGRIRTDTGAEVPAEEFLTGVVAAEIPAEYGIETLKAQAVLARTYIYRLVDPGLERIREEEENRKALMDEFDNDVDEMDELDNDEDNFDSDNLDSDDFGSDDFGGDDF